MKPEECLVHIRDSNRYGDPPDILRCKNFTWVYDRQPCDADITVFVDRRMLEAFDNKSRIKVAWLMEPPVIDGLIYEFALRNKGLFNAVMTYSKELVALGPPFVFYPYGTTWIAPENRMIYPKKLLLSSIVSSKRYAPGHLVRHQIVEKYRDKIDVSGNGYRPIPNKLEALAPYMYQMVAENNQYDDFFTEKVMDCFMTGVVPIYWGTKNIGDYFDLRGILTFNTVDEFGSILSKLSVEDYMERLPYIHENLSRAQQYADLDENVWHAYLKLCFPK